MIYRLTKTFPLAFFSFTAVFLSPPSSSSSSSSSISTTTNLHIDCNMKIETLNSHHSIAISRAFDNLAKAAAQVRKRFFGRLNSFDDLFRLGQIQIMILIHQHTHNI